MFTLRKVIWMVPVAVTISEANVARGQNHPNKTLRIVTGAPGGGAGFVARLIAHGIAGSLGQQVIVDNRDGVIPGEIVSQVQPDGYTLLCYPGSPWTRSPQAFVLISGA